MAIKKTPGLGHTVCEAITGYKGVVTQVLEMLNGTVQFAVQPKQGKLSADGYPEGWQLDFHLLDYVDAGVADRVVAPTVVPTIVLGEQVKDMVTGFEGIATSKHLFINGCYYWTVLPPLSSEDKKQGAISQSQFISNDRLVRTGPGVAKIHVKAPPSIDTGKRPGGPSSRAQRAT